MHGQGFEEASAPYLFDPRKLSGQVRRLGDAGPAYEIIAVDEPGKVAIEVIHSGERVSCPVEEVMEDPKAETFP